VGFRFRRSVKLMPGIRVNFSLSGVGLGLGIPGFNASLGPGGRFLNLGVPGTGLSYSHRLSETGRANKGTAAALGGSGLANIGRDSDDLERQMLRLAEQRRAAYDMEVSCAPIADGSLQFVDGSGATMSEEALSMVNPDHVSAAIERACAQINNDIELLPRIHEGTSHPEIKPRYVPQAFDETRPVEPQPVVPKFWDRLLGRALLIKGQNDSAHSAHESAIAEWEGRRRHHEVTERQVAELVEAGIYRDEDAMMQFLEARLSTISWPRETLVSFDVIESGKCVCLDVDLPELEDMPAKSAKMPSRGLRLLFKELSPTKIRKIYADHIHGVLFRLAGEAFAALPTVQTVVASGYSQRIQTHDGRVLDEYLLSLRVSREHWHRIDFGRLDAVSPTDALSQFELRRNMTKSGKFAAIEPIT
jgi:hypothetical protein